MLTVAASRAGFRPRKSLKQNIFRESPRHPAGWRATRAASERADAMWEQIETEIKRLQALFANWMNIRRRRARLPPWTRPSGWLRSVCRRQDSASMNAGNSGWRRPGAGMPPGPAGSLPLPGYGATFKVFKSLAHRIKRAFFCRVNRILKIFLHSGLIIKF